MLGAAVLLSAGPGPAGAQPASPASAHYEHGKKLGRAKRYDEALREFRAAYEIDPRPVCLYNIAWALERLGRAPEALDAYRAYLDGTDPGDASWADAQRAVRELAPGVKKLELAILRVGDVDAASRVRIDDRFANAPGQPLVVHVAPGKHAVTREVDGRPVKTVRVTVAAGDDKLVAVVGVDALPGSAAPDRSAAPPAPSAALQAPRERKNPGSFVAGVTLLVHGSLAHVIGPSLLLYWAKHDCTGFVSGTCQFNGLLYGGVGTIVAGVPLIATGAPLVIVGNRMVAPGTTTAGAIPEIVLMPGGMGLRGVF
jgi:hypothetical protein